MADADLGFLDKPLDAARRMADAADDLMFDLGDAAPIAQRLLGALAMEYLAGAPDRRKIRRVLKALAFVSASIIAANGDAANAAYERFWDDLRGSVRQIRRG